MASPSDRAGATLRPGTVVWVGPDREDGMAVLEGPLDKGKIGDGWCLMTNRGGRWYPMDQIEIADVPDAWGALARQCVLEVQRAESTREEARRTLATVSGACEQARRERDEAEYEREKALGMAELADHEADLHRGEVLELRAERCLLRVQVERLTEERDAARRAADRAEVEGSRLRGECTRHRVLAEEARRTLATVSGACEQYRDVIDDVRAALGHGADEDAWPPGLTVAAAVARLRGRLEGSRAEVRRLAEQRDRLYGWLGMIDGGDSPCDDPATLREWAMRALRGDPVSGEDDDE